MSNQTALSPVQQLSSGAALLLQIAMAMGGFAIGISEFAIMGLMPNVSASLSVTETEVGHAISAYALGVVIGAPLLAILGAKLARRPQLILLMLFYALGNIATALSPDYGTLLIFRFFAGLPHGAYFGLISLVAASLVPANQRAKAVSRVMMGITLAMLLGNPIATWIGQTLTWRYAFALVSVLAFLAVVMIAVFLPSDPNEKRSDPLTELKAFNRKPVWLALAIGSVGFAGMFCVFSYLAPTILEVTRVSKEWIPLALAAFGVGAILGNIAGGWLFDRYAFKAIGILLLWSTAILLLFPETTHSLPLLLFSTFTVGTMISLSPAVQTHLMDVAEEAQTLAAASNHAAFNFANALGPWLGGMAIASGFGWSSTGFVGAATAVTGLLVFLIAWREEHKSGRLSTQPLS